MKAICGLISRLYQQPTISNLLQKMVAVLPLEQRAGDSRVALWAGGGLGYCAQFNETGTQHQSLQGMCRQRDLSIVCDSEFYNLAELKKKLSNQICPEATNAEILAAAYRAYGLDCVRHLKGAFAFAIWDDPRQQLLLATDPFGIRPLHYYHRSGLLVFGTRINALLEVPEVPQEIHPDAIYQYLYFSCVPTPNTIYSDIRKLPPGHFLLESPSGVRLEPYWQMKFREEPQHSARHFANALRQNLTEAVHVQATYNGDTERLGAFLSGGTDSSTITGLLSQFSSQPARSFSIGFKEDVFNEIEYARIAARHFRTDHHEYFVGPTDVEALIPKLIQAYDEPFGNASAVPTYYCALMAKQNGIKTLLAGDGGDELFGGNTRYATDKFFQIYQTLPIRLRRDILEPVLYGLPGSDDSLISRARKYVRRSNIPQPQRFFSYNLLHTVELNELFADDFLATFSDSPALALARQYYEKAEATSMLNRLLHIDLKITITDNDLRKVTRMCELAGVQVRYPMLDQTLAEFSGTIPANLKVKGFNKRYIFKKAFQDFLPKQILTKKKHGFGLPISPWLKQNPRLRELARETLLSQASLERGYFKKSFLQNFFELHQTDKTNFFGDNLWVFLILELWHQAQK